MNIKNILGFGIDKQLYVPTLISIDELGLGEDVTDKALTIASFWKGVNIISNSIASFPFRIYKDKEIQRSSDLYYLLKHKPNEYQTSKPSAGEGRLPKKHVILPQFPETANQCFGGRACRRPRSSQKIDLP